MSRNVQVRRRLPALASIAVALALPLTAFLALVGPAQATDPPPIVEHCWWWPGTTAVHWDKAYLLTHYRSNYVVKVVFEWNSTWQRTATVNFPAGDRAEVTTPIGATVAKAVIHLGNGEYATDSVDCVIH